MYAKAKLTEPALLLTMPCITTCTGSALLLGGLGPGGHGRHSRGPGQTATVVGFTTSRVHVDDLKSVRLTADLGADSERDLTYGAQNAKSTQHYPFHNTWGI